jgi:hypothetical protein
MVWIFSLRRRVQTDSEVKRAGREADHSPPSSAEVNNAWSYTSTPPNVFMTWCLVKHTDVCTFTFNFIFSSLFWFRSSKGLILYRRMLGLRWEIGSSEGVSPHRKTQTYIHVPEAAIPVLEWSRSRVMITMKSWLKTIYFSIRFRKMALLFEYSTLTNIAVQR